MRLFIVIVFCFLLSGCGLFNKTKKIDRQLEAAKVSKNVELSTDTKQETVDKSISNETKKEESKGEIKIYPKPGAPVVVGADGTVTGEVDSIITNVRRKSDEAKNLAKDVKETLQKKSDSIASSDSTGRKENYALDQKKETSMKGILSNYIGWLIFLIPLLLFLFWYFGIKRKT